MQQANGGNNGRTSTEYKAGNYVDQLRPMHQTKNLAQSSNGGGGGRGGCVGGVGPRPWGSELFKGTLHNPTTPIQPNHGGEISHNGRAVCGLS